MPQTKVKPKKIVAGVDERTVQRACREIDTARQLLESEAEDCTVRGIELRLKRMAKGLEHIWGLVYDLYDDLDRERERIAKVFEE